MGILLTDEESRVLLFEHRTEKLYKAVPRPGEMELPEEEDLTCKKIYEWLLLNYKDLDIYRRNIQIRNEIFGIKGNQFKFQMAPKFNEIKY